MHSSKLFQLLRSLEANEIHWLHKFLKSPYHNSNPQYLRLFEYIKKCYPNLEHPKLGKEIVFKKLYPKEAFDPQKMRKLMHELAVLVEEFLVIHHLKNNRFEHRKILTAELGRRNHYKAFEKETSSLLTKLEREEKRGENHFLESYQLRKQLFAHPLTVRGQESGEKIVKMSEELDQYFFLQQLILDTALKSNKKVFSENNQIYSIEKLYPIFEIEEENDNPILLMYQYIHQMLTKEKGIDFFEKAFKKFILYKSSFEQKTNQEILQFLISYTFTEIRNGNISFIQRQFDLYKIGLEEHIIIQQNRITKNTFSNIVSCGAFLGEYKWTEKFIAEKSKFLEETDRGEIISLNKANLSFKQGSFENAIEYLIATYFDNILYSTSAKTLLVKCYFELFLEDETYFDLLMAQINSFEKFLRRERKLNVVKKKQFLNFTLLVKQIAKDKLNRADVSTTLNRLNNIGVIVAKPWLQKKLKELNT